MTKKTVKKENIALFGGSFDPLHNGHADIVTKLAKKFDKVYVLPCNVSPFKKGAKVIDGELRVAALQKTFADLNNVEISRFELDKKGVSYSYLTAAAFAKTHPNANLFYVIGSDGISTLEDWKGVDKLAQTVTFYVVPRPGSEIDATALSRCKMLGIGVKVAPFKGKNISSAEIRAALAFGKGAKLLPPAMEEIIRENGLYSEYADIVARFPEFNLKKSRITHTYAVVKAAITLAKKNGVDVSDAITAALLHDIGKGWTPTTLEKAGVAVSKKIKNMPEPCQHAYIGELIAKNFFGIKKAAILKAIRQHTTGAEDMSALAKVIFLADCVAAGRSYAGLEEIKEIVFGDLDMGMEFALARTLDYLKEKGGKISPDTQKAYEYYYMLNNSPELLAARMEKTKKPAKPAKKQTAPKIRTSAPMFTKAELDEDYSGAKLAEMIGKFASDKKGHDVCLVDIRAKTIISDFFVIAGAGSSSQVRAIADYVDEKLSKDYGIEPYHRDVDAKWIAVDYGTVILHVFHDDARKFYELERLWSDGENIKRV